LAIWLFKTEYRVLYPKENPVGSIFYTQLATMEFDLESARNQGTEPLDARFSNVPSLTFHHLCPYNSGLTVHGFFVPLTYCTMCSSAPIEQSVSSGFRASFANDVREERPEGEILLAVSSQIDRQNQDPALSANFEFDFNTPQVQTSPPCPAPGHQDW
jgi:hypothetical protein